MESALTSRLAPGITQDPPVLFVHGAWHGAWCWDTHFLGAFAEAGYDAYALDLRGHDGSGESMRRFSLDDYLDDIQTAVSEIGTEPILVGHSMGGYLVQRHLETQRAPAAVLIASIPPKGALGIALRLLRSQPAAFLKTQAQLRLWPLVETPELARDLFMREDATDLDAELLQSRLQDESFRAFLGLLTRRIRHAETATPTLVLGAEQDRVVTIGEVNATAAHFGTDAVLLPEMAHDVMLDPDWKLASDAILTWLGEVLEPDDE
jgi:pimeloyl-ACP methyl ester carboxylesterase